MSGEGGRVESTSCAGHGPMRVAVSGDGGHARIEERSLLLHRAIPEKLKRNPEAVLVKARSNLRRLREIHGPSPYWDRWERWLRQPVEELAAFLVSDSEEARMMRQCTPFAGVLSARERWGVYRAFREGEFCTEVVRAGLARESVLLARLGETECAPEVRRIVEARILRDFTPAGGAGP